MNRIIQNPVRNSGVYKLCHRKLYLIGTWLLHTRNSTLSRLFYKEKFFFREILEFG
jgi:hypothetical protein